MGRELVLGFLLLLIPLAHGAVITGSVYDFSFEETQAIVEINTSPAQRMVADSEYSFSVPIGNYLLSARQVRVGQVVAATSQEVKVNSEGEFVIDLVLFPELGEDIDLEEPEIAPEEFNYNEDGNNGSGALVQGFFLLMVLILLYLFHTAGKSGPGRELDPDARKVFSYVNKHKRVTQKEIRKEFPYSEAKISLIITELEDKGLVKKIKKGRGNIIVRN